MKVAQAGKVLPLFRPPIALFAACSGLTGYLLVPGKGLLPIVAVCGGILLLAAGASGLNQYQERAVDALMERTRTRPLPAGIITAGQARAWSLALIATGLCLLLLSGRLPGLLGLVAVAWYNGVYTLLKRRTAFAAVPGALVGMLPPAVGWTTAGGSLADPRFFALSFLFFLWQVPHFWLQVLHHGPEYEHAGMPSLSALVSREQLGRMIFIWICAAAAAGLLLPLYGTLSSPLLYFLLLPAGCSLIIKALPLLRPGSPERSLSAFRMINIYMLVIMSLLSTEGLLLH